MAVWFDKLTKAFSRANSAKPGPAAAAADPPEQPENPLNSTSLSTKFAPMRDVWKLLTPYFMESEEKSTARMRIAAITALTLATSGSAIYFNYWANRFFSSAQALAQNPTDEERDRFNRLLGEFALLSAGTAFAVHRRQQIQGNFKADWNAWMLKDRMGKVLENNVNVRLPRHTDIENPLMRLRYSTFHTTNGATELGVGLMQAAAQLPPFAIVLWNLSGNGDISALGHTINVPGYLMWGAVAYAGIGAGLAAKFGKPLNQLYDEWGDRDTALMATVNRVHANAKNISLYDAEKREQEDIQGYIEKGREVDLKINRKETFLGALRKADTDVGYVLPYVASIGFIGSAKRAWGEIAQVAHAFSEVQSSLRWYFNSRSDIARFRSAADTVIRLDKAMAVAAQRDREQYDPDSTGLRLLKGDPDSDISFKDLTIYRPGTDIPLIEGMTERIEQGSRIIVMAPTGWGKTTFINTLAGHGDKGSGSISLPDGPKTMIIPQGRFIPPLPLKEILAYPKPGDTYAREDMVQALSDVGLSHLIPDLDKTEKVGSAYEGALSGGEAQRLTFARIFLAKPDILITDEITAALDAKWEKKVYGKLVETLPYSTIISISHREGLIEFHDTIAVPEGKTLKFSPINDSREEAQAVISKAPLPLPPI